MNVVGAWAWNVLFSAALAFACVAGMVVIASRRRFADRRPRLAALLLALPFAKFAFELARGVPEGAFFWDKLGGAVQEKGAFSIGFGADHLGPLVRVTLGALTHGNVHPQSLADVLATAADRRIAAGTTSTIGLVLAGVALVLVVRELAGLMVTSRALRRHVAAGVVVGTHRIAGRTVRLVVSPTWTGVPFAGGFFRPWVCVSSAAQATYGAAEWDAIVLHELAHLRYLDAWLLAGVRVMRAALWFVPGAGALARAVAAQCEVAADADAVRRGADPTALASALVRTAEANAEVPLLAFVNPRTLHRRVARLLDAPPTERTSIVAIGLVVLLAWTLLRMTACGNP